MQLFQLVGREVRVVARHWSEIFNLLVFFIIISFLFAFATAEIINFQIAVSAIIVCFMLASNLSSHFIFDRDLESGVLQQLYIRVNSLNSLIFAKMLSQYLCFGLPLVLTIPLAAVFFSLPFGHTMLLMLLVLAVAPVLAVINVMISGITSGLKQGSIVSVILSIPLYIPVVILSLSFMESQGTESQMGVLALYGNVLAYLMVLVPLAIFAVRQTIRNAIAE